ncbi:MAG: pyridoxal 5'-phosphate synthase [Pseudomonadales bacterium]|jgi:pyridoxamine 5'-phosphate oxidase|nr:pyridoxal 5'-phosphate synthase [Pseudomonadales bacterium]
MTLYNELLPDPLPLDPLPIAAGWLLDAWSSHDQPNPNAMVLATTTLDGRPSARVVLCKEIRSELGYLTFVSNYESRKGEELARNARAAAVMHWDHVHRQLRFEGLVQQAPPKESDEYFRSRTWQRRIGAWASAQSRPLARRQALFEQIEAAAKRFGTPLPGPENDDASRDVTFDVPRPPFWGGYHFWIDAVELWVEGESRYHERARWTRTLITSGGAPQTGPWTATRLQP